MTLPARMVEAPVEGDSDLAVALVTARSGGQALLETVALHLLLHGNAYVQILEGADGAPGEFFALRPDRVSVEVDTGGWPVAYSYRVGAETLRIPAEDGLDACALGLLCRDDVADGGERWGLRYEECLALEAIWVRRELGRVAGALRSLAPLSAATNFASGSVSLAASPARGEGKRRGVRRRVPLHQPPLQASPNASVGSTGAPTRPLGEDLP